MTQITKKQHFVPKAYLKQFARNGQVQVLDVRAKRILKARSCTSVCYGKFFYAAETGVRDGISQAFEQVFGQIEDQYTKALPGIIERSLDLQLTNGDLVGLAYFMSVQWLRTDSFRERIQNAQSELLKWVLKQRASLPGFEDYLRSTTEAGELSDEQLEEVNRLIQSGEYDFRFDNTKHLDLIDEEKVNGFRNVLLGMRWRIYFSEEPYHFITSDNPVAEWVSSTQGIFGPAFWERAHLLALTPGILIGAHPSDSVNPEQQPVGRLSYHAANRKGVLIFNKVLANSAHRYAYSHHRDALVELLEELKGRNCNLQADPSKARHER